MPIVILFVGFVIFFIVTRIGDRTKAADKAVREREKYDQQESEAAKHGFRWMGGAPVEGSVFNGLRDHSLLAHQGDGDLADGTVVDLRQYDWFTAADPPPAP
jgi:hypothetical protein